jgi:fructosamine-3-kinase
MNDWTNITTAISEATGIPFEAARPQALSGGCINRALQLDDGKRRFFVKLNQASRLDMFEAEADGLREIEQSATLRVPRVICSGITDSDAYLVLEYVEMGRGGDSARAGEQLARMHRVSSERFGWWRDNHIGATPQPNAQRSDWVDFWREQRLGFQLTLAHQKGGGDKLRQRGERLLEQLPALLDHAPQPSLLHGDLWGGNMGFDLEGDPVTFDPAVYYGDREADLAMTELFGGFDSRFYAAYEESWPLDPGYPTRKTLYNLYHILNHFNLFGGGYGGQALGMIDRLLAELG